MKNKFAALIAATFVATPVMAQNVDNQVFANQNVKAIELSQTEMKETQGEFALNAAGAGLGALGGGISYTTSVWASGGKWSHKQFAASVGAGAVSGALLNPWAGATVGAAAGGVINGLGSRPSR